MAQLHTETHISRLTLDIPSDLHRTIKAHASLNKLSIKDFMMKLVEKNFHEIERTQKDFNATTIRTIRHSIKNHHKLKTFNISDDAMKWLLEDNTKTKKPKKKNEKS